jgi:hypothetical protein
VNKGDNTEKLESCNRTPVQPVSPMRGEARERDNAEGADGGSFFGDDKVRGGGRNGRIRWEGGGERIGEKCSVSWV